MQYFWKDVIDENILHAGKEIFQSFLIELFHKACEH
jgi:hypothetical protein